MGNSHQTSSSTNQPNHNLKEKHLFHSYCIGINMLSHFHRSLKPNNNKCEAHRNLRIPFCGNYDIFRRDLFLLK